MADGALFFKYSNAVLRAGQLLFVHPDARADRLRHGVCTQYIDDGAGTPAAFEAARFPSLQIPAGDQHS